MTDCRNHSPATASDTCEGVENPAGTATEATRNRLVEEISRSGPVTATTLAKTFGLTAAGVRRHLIALEADGLITQRNISSGKRGRGRPSKAFVLTEKAHSDLGSEYDALAALAIEHLERLGGREAIAQLAEHRVDPWQREYETRLENYSRDHDGSRPSPKQRVEILADLLSARGYAGSVRPVTVRVAAPDGEQRTMRTLATAQLCQGHCPVQDIATRHPELCDVETEAISRMLGVPVQRLATLAKGAHACTTHIPLTEGRTP
ncbi:helix-turn-helix transcriptional regulator [Devriesea agamarum]|uniref:helix-turn-helix transcriptional regulator n=1 Tax=Devriesea agamarum TaxID=472569 RepID=UPI000AE60F99|nr:helix-turn-helix domain-containing protein [Devriesea agamarum]